MTATFYAHIEFKAPSNWSVNLAFLCSKCGVCCTLDDFLTAGPLKTNPQNPQRLKAQTLYEELGKRWETNPAKYDHYITHTPCPFLVDQICSIYEIRPKGCRQFPNTPFGMQTQDCQALNRFKKQLQTLKKGQTTKVTYHFIEQTLIPIQLTEKQYQHCIVNLQKTDITQDELTLFYTLNKQTDPTAVND